MERVLFLKPRDTEFCLLGEREAVLSAVVCGQRESGLCYVTLRYGTSFVAAEISNQCLS